MRCFISSTIDDPTAFSKPWTGELPLTAAPGPIYEYACHEGNYAIGQCVAGAQAKRRRTTGNRRSELRRNGISLRGAALVNRSFQSRLGRPRPCGSPRGCEGTSRSGKYSRSWRRRSRRQSDAASSSAARRPTSTVRADNSRTAPRRPLSRHGTQRHRLRRPATLQWW